MLGWGVVCLSTLFSVEGTDGTSSLTENSGRPGSSVARRVQGGQADYRDAAMPDCDERQEHGLRREAADRAAVFEPQCPGGTKHWSFEVVRGDGDKHLVEAEFKGDEAGHAGNLVDGADEDAGDCGSVHEGGCQERSHHMRCVL